MNDQPTSGKRTASSAFSDAVNADYHTKQLGENGCPEYTDLGVGSNVLAISQLVRGGDPTNLAKEIFAGGSPREVSDLMVLLFSTRNTRGGKGEKKLAFDLFFLIWNDYPKTAKELLHLFSHYGYWKDLLLISEMCVVDKATVQEGDKLVAASVELMSIQLRKDIAALEEYKRKLAAAKDDEEQVKIRQKGPTISLLSKWLPRENSHFDKKIGFVSLFTKVMWPQMSPSEQKASVKAKVVYRKTIAELTSFLELPEVLLSAQRADEINLNKLASKATLRLTKAFLNEDKEGNPKSEDPKRIKLADMFMNHVVKKGAKGGQVMPHEIVKEIMNGKKISKTRELVLDAQWKDIWKKVVEEVTTKAKEEGLEFNPTRMVPLTDVSGSMYGTPIEVAVALGIGVSEITHPAFQNMVMTFTTEPAWHRLNPADTIVKKVQSLKNAPWDMSTNFEAAYDLILKTCLDHKLAREDVPSLIVFSDMQFDAAAGMGGYSYSYTSHRYETAKSKDMDTMHDVIRKKVAKVATELGWTDAEPTPIVYWNLRNAGGHPVNKDTEGTVLLSGFSPSLLKLVMNGEALREEKVEVVQKDGTVKTEKVRVTPEQVLRKMLDDTLYDPVRLVLASSTEGALKEFELPMELVKAEGKEKETEDAAVEDDGFALVDAI